ncbi:hypothetical protein E2542_SST03556 [Spatholobus suberectus]|nr:hypothetical protein E2542_SST03556 [Spatholobus suberectus]
MAPPLTLSPSQSLATNDANTTAFISHVPSPQLLRFNGSPVSKQRKWVMKPSSNDLRVLTFMMEKVTILWKGESLDLKLKSEALKNEGDDLVVIRTQRVGPNLKMVPKQIQIMYFMFGYDAYTVIEKELGGRGVGEGGAGVIDDRRL